MTFVKKEYPRNPNTFCKLCGKACYKRPNELRQAQYKALYCSKSCYHQDHPPKKKTCPVCSEEYVGHSQNTCSRKCANIKRTGIKYNQGQLNNKAKKHKDIKSKLIELRGKQCELCPYDNVNVLQVHHIVEKSKGGTDEENNLLLICPNCHCTIHYGDSRC